MLSPDRFQQIAQEIEGAVGGTIVGQRDAVRGVLLCLLTGGHALLEGVPGLGKTTMARAFAEGLALEHRRVQFTPDLMPADITGTMVLSQDGAGAELRFQPGPLFANLVVADEINRAAPRTQSALLEAMQERRVTIGNVTHALPQPFTVLATQNPVEMRGTYPLPEAELDRFLLKLGFDFPDEAELTETVTRTTGGVFPPAPQVADAETLREMIALARSVPAAAHVIGYASRLVLALQPAREDATELARRWVELGPSPRGAQALTLAGRVTALLAGRANLAFEDVRAVGLPALRHRLVLSFEAEREGVTAEAIVEDALERVATAR
ncbi:MoxR family ATPase [Conexibacter stalactiti]|uniref:MoxR family ATPase n=1 Tax=Conexibacter stalactiti TaxID=1940611 RepID=A0ABU4HX60_9ACTN|nr:MoxR family ATPase [Conexibacter stalactiti]MDW5597449.1 MoxR family ATPase [Conexibacter stalactiti]MEC5038091.1 MoxR family ATPase [Conexibacter stalactiti]